MQQQRVLEHTVDYVKRTLAGDSSHDWWHIERVWKNAVELAKTERADPFVVQLAALLHDIADWKFHAGDDSVGPRVAREWLVQQEVDEANIAHVCEIIHGLSFKGAGVTTAMRTLEGQVVQDADRLDALGAIGIARAFAYGGSRGRELHNPGIPPEMHATFEQYKRNNGPTINHFYEKLLLLAARMNTASGKALAAGRHAYMEQFLSQFLNEWDGRM